MFRASTAHHQEVRCMYVANSTSKMTASEPVILEVLDSSTIENELFLFVVELKRVHY
jgi:hypothetical protein